MPMYVIVFSNRSSRTHRHVVAVAVLNTPVWRMAREVNAMVESACSLPPAAPAAGSGSATGRAPRTEKRVRNTDIHDRIFYFMDLDHHPVQLRCSHRQRARRRVPAPQGDSQPERSAPRPAEKPAEGRRRRERPVQAAGSTPARRVASPRGARGGGQGRSARTAAGALTQRAHSQRQPCSRKEFTFEKVH